MRNYILAFAAIVTILTLGIIVAARYVAWLNFDAKDWIIFGLATLIIFAVGAFVKEFSGWSPYGGS